MEGAINLSGHTGTAPPAPKLIVGRDRVLDEIKDSLLSGLRPSGGTVTLNREAFRKSLEMSGLTRDQLAEKTKTVPRTINNVENQQPVRESTARQIAAFLNVDLSLLLKTPTEKTVVALHAPAGMGKTTVLQAICHDDNVRAILSDGTLWAPLGQTPDIAGILTQWAFSLRVKEIDHMMKSGQPYTLDFLRVTLNAALSGRKILLLLDDVWNADHVGQLLVGGGGCPALITTRHLDLAPRLVSIASLAIPLKRLVEDDAVRLLELLAGDVAKDNPEATRELASALEGHPLALQVAGRLIATQHATGLDARSLMTKLREPEQILDEEAPSDQGRSKQTVDAILRLSTDSLSNLDRICFAFLSSWEAKPAPLNLEMMEQSWKPFGVDTKKMAQRLAGQGLLEPLGDGKFWIHSLLVAHGRSILKSLRG